MINKCRHCGAYLEHEVIDLGHQPPSNSYLDNEQLLSPELTYPLKVYVCHTCWLVQLPTHATAEELFTSDYAYFSSTSTSWCKHSENFEKKVVKKLDLGPNSLVVELASNDGYLLQYFLQDGIPCLGIEPTQAVAKVARSRGIQTIEEFFGHKLAMSLEKADLVIANNVLAHVPDINDFILGISVILKSTGYATFEFPHLLRMLDGNQFDTIYHEHYSYLSLKSVKRILYLFGLDVIDVEELPTHGGSLRVWACHKGYSSPSKSVQDLLLKEQNYGIEKLFTYRDFQSKAELIKNALVKYLIQAKEDNNLILGYGAAAKGNTILNYAGIRSDLLKAVADKAESKQGKFLPGSHIPIVSPEQIFSMNPRALLVLPWNLIDEIRHQYPQFRLITSIPQLKII